jgi:cytochrome c oxidase assembly protein subunit 15
MQDVALFNPAPVLQLMGMGLLLAGLPLLWLWHRHRHGSSARRLQALTLLTLFLTFDLVLFGAFTRLTDSGLGCPDWPGCYGSASPLGAQQQITAAQSALPTGPVTHGKAWVEMVHRYLATGVGVLIMVLAWRTWRAHRRAPEQAIHPLWPLLTLAWVCLQGAFGALTVTMKLFPLIVTLHLLLGIGLLALLTVQAVRYEGWRSVPVSTPLRWGLWLALALLCLQMALGGWVSTNYAVLACQDFPTCNGQWWPEVHVQGFELWRPLGHDAQGQLLPVAALVTLHVVHRSMALLVLPVLLWTGVRLGRVQGLASSGRALVCLSLLQLITGLSNVVLDWPLLAAVMHTGGAAALTVVLCHALARSCQQELHVAASPAHPIHSFKDSRPAA